MLQSRRLSQVKKIHRDYLKLCYSCYITFDETKLNSFLIRLFHFITLNSNLNIDTSWDEMEWNVMGNVETGILDSEDELCGRLVFITVEILNIFPMMFYSLQN